MAPRSQDDIELTGSLWIYVLFNVAEEIRLDTLRPADPGREPKFRHPAPGYVRFEHPPVIERLPEAALSTGERFGARIKYFDYGVVSVEFELAFRSGWDTLIRQVQRLFEQTEVEPLAGRIARERVSVAGAAVVKPYREWLSEDYLVVVISGTSEPGLPSGDLVSQYGDRLSQLVRGESQRLSPSQTQEVLSGSISYYPSDLLIVAWAAAVIYDSAEAANPTLQLLEYANTRLLEFRHYDEVLKRLSADLHKILERRGGILRHWRMAREAAQLNALRLDVMELADRSDNAIRFLSDMFYARVDRLAAEKIGVGDYRALVDEKLKIAGDLYQFIVGEFHNRRAFILEAMIVVILIIDLIYLFRGKA